MEEFWNRANKLTRKYYSLNKTILGHKYVDTDTKMKINNIITVPTVTYSSENWVSIEKT